MQWFIACLAKNGQILSEFQNTVKYADHYSCRVVAPELDSLDKKYGNKYTAQFFQAIEKLSAKPPELVYIGENYDAKDCCTCKVPGHYVLSAGLHSSASPVVCGDCNKSVPLYRFPKTYDNTEYYDLLGWQKVYQSCDRQFLEGIGERHGYKMMHDPGSPLSKEALRYCRQLEEAVGKPFYYRLFTYYRNNKSTCPKCGHPWRNVQPEISKKIHYSYVCHGCRLVSDDSC